MSLKVEALSPMEGVAIIRIGGTLRLIRPPYKLRDCPELPDGSAQDAILKHGFLVSEQQFASWDQAIDYLNHHADESRRAVGNLIPDSIAGRDILELAPQEVLDDFLNRVERELIPQRLFDHAENFLLTLLESDVLARHPELGRRAARLLRRNKEKLEQANAAVSELANRDLRFPCLERHGALDDAARMANAISERGSVFAVGS